jgi:two-component system LytT family response regulator
MSRPVRAMIVDDEPAARDAIRLLLAGDPDLQVVGEGADGRSALDAIRALAPDLLFLDVQMPEMDGFTLLRQLDPSELPVVVFTTAYDRYALDAFEVHAVDYLLKPFDDDRFRVAVRRAKERVRRGRIGALTAELRDLLDDAPGAPARRPGSYRKRFVIKSGGTVTLIDVKDVDWVEADGDYVKIHAGKRWYALRETMKRLSEELDPARFVRIHRSTIVNLERIGELQPYFHGEYAVILRDGTRLRLSRGYHERLEAALRGEPAPVWPLPRERG